MVNLLARLGARWTGEAHFWATHAGAELDLLVVRGPTRLGFEVKRTSAPKMTPSMRLALEDLRIDRIDVLYAGRGVRICARRVSRGDATGGPGGCPAPPVGGFGGTAVPRLRIPAAPDMLTDP